MRLVRSSKCTFFINTFLELCPGLVLIVSFVSFRQTPTSSRNRDVIILDHVTNFNCTQFKGRKCRKVQRGVKTYIYFIVWIHWIETWGHFMLTPECVLRKKANLTTLLSSVKCVFAHVWTSFEAETTPATSVWDTEHLDEALDTADCSERKKKGAGCRIAALFIYHQPNNHVQ